MPLRKTKCYGFNKFQFLVTATILVVQVAVVGLVDADVSSYLSPGVFRWAYNPSEESTAFYNEGSDPVADPLSWGVCTGIRGGRLGKRDSTRGNSTADEAVTVVLEKPNVDYATSPYAFSLFQENDGSESDPDGIPERYLRMQHYNRDHAKKALASTLKWRKEHDIDTILARPNAKFDTCKKVFPHFFCGHDETKHVILLQRPGLINLKLAHSNQITGDDLLYHYVYEMEYLWKILEPDANATMTSVIDLSGLNLSVLTKPELLNVVQKFCSTMDAHFPLRSHRTLLINAPRWFGGLFKMISPLLRESTKQKISILSKGKKQQEVLKSLLVECEVGDNLTVEDIAPTEMEKHLRDFVLARLEESNEKMEATIG